MWKCQGRDLLAWLRKDGSQKGQGTYAMIFCLLTSGLRASGLCQLFWGSLDHVEGIWTARFIGKGNQEAEQVLYGPAVEACKHYFMAMFSRMPEAADALFWTVPTFPGDTTRPIAYHTQWHRVKEAGKAARAAGVIERDFQFSPHLFRRTYAPMLYKGRPGTRTSRCFAGTTWTIASLQLHICHPHSHKGACCRSQSF